MKNRIVIFNIKIVLLFFATSYGQVYSDTSVAENGDTYLYLTNERVKQVVKVSADSLYQTYFQLKLNEDSSWGNFGITRVFKKGKLIRSEFTLEGNLINHEEYYSDGNLIRSYRTKDGVLNGDYMEFNDLGNLIVKGEYFHGLKKGLWTNWDNEGSIIFNGEYLILKVAEDEIENYADFIDQWNGKELYVRNGTWWIREDGRLKEYYYEKGRLINR